MIGVFGDVLGFRVGEDCVFIMKFGGLYGGEGIVYFGN